MTKTTAETIDPKIIALLPQLADTAGEIARRYWRVPAGVEKKADTSPVTKADHEIEAALRKLIEKTFPSHGIIGEEHGATGAGAAWQWVIDPIDGTRSFIAGYPIFATLIGLVKDGVPVAGVIDQPITKERWTGIEGHFTICNAKRVGVSQVTKLSDATVATTSIDYFSTSQLEAYGSLKRLCGRNVLGGDAYAFAMLASGRMDIVVDAGLKQHDFCALVPVVEGAGGIITDWNGKPVTLACDGRVVAAANRELHAQALAVLRS